jgi:hypothetical protein
MQERSRRRRNRQLKILIRMKRGISTFCLAGILSSFITASRFVSASATAIVAGYTNPSIRYIWFIAGASAAAFFTVA